MTTEKAPVAGQTPGGTGSGSRFGRQSALADVGDDALAEALRAAMRDGSGGSSALNEMLRASAAARNMPDLFGVGPGTGEGASAAAGVLTAVDEDEDGAEEAAVPGEFEYFTDNEDDEEL